MKYKKQNFDSRNSTSGLKRTSKKNEYYDVESKSLFTKENGKLKMIVDNEERKLHKQTLERLRYYGKKYNTSVEQQITNEKKRWKEYTDSIKSWNKGDIKRASTVGKKRDDFNTMATSTKKYFDKNNKKLSNDINEKKKVMIMRLQGIHGVYNSKAYEEWINKVADKLKKPRDLVESLMFPSGIEETGTYEYKKDKVDDAFYSLDDLIDEQIDNDEISENDAFFLKEYITDMEDK